MGNANIAPAELYCPAGTIPQNQPLKLKPTGEAIAQKAQEKSPQKKPLTLKAYTTLVENFVVNFGKQIQATLGEHGIATTVKSIRSSDNGAYFRYEDIEQIGDPFGVQLFIPLPNGLIGSAHAFFRPSREKGGVDVSGILIEFPQTAQNQTEDLPDEATEQMDEDVTIEPEQAGILPGDCPTKEFFATPPLAIEHIVASLLYLLQEHQNGTRTANLGVIRHEDVLLAK